ncbi:HaaA family cyclophane-containing RiPP peptide [Streptomyces sp. MUM 2J]|uniref:HaaA family cyclophane-containing RiPP peptide n=1 Tax=Streptomyces sp. MUM 2J TaxID=2791987 RepID=UPI0027E4B4B5|nr:HaaA family cyclophane-containing RiPP peptide [Streptomyces sp. MUM 2J]
MSSRTPVLAPPTTGLVRPTNAQGNDVLERVAARVQQRLAAETSREGHHAEGPHAASLVLPWWF